MDDSIAERDTAQNTAAEDTAVQDSTVQDSTVQDMAREDLSATECLLVWAMRVWVAHHRAGAVPCRGYSYAFIRVGLPDAPLLLHRLMQVVAAHARRGIDVRCIGCPRVSPDEGRLLSALAAAQRGDLAAGQAPLRDLMDASAVNWAHAVLATLAAQMTAPEHRLPQRAGPSAARPLALAPAMTGDKPHACVDPGAALVH